MSLTGELVLFNTAAPSAEYISLDPRTSTSVAAIYSLADRVELISAIGSFSVTSSPEASSVVAAGFIPNDVTKVTFSEICKSPCAIVAPVGLDGVSGTVNLVGSSFGTELKGAVLGQAPPKFCVVVQSTVIKLSLIHI